MKSNLKTNVYCLSTNNGNYCCTNCLEPSSVARHDLPALNMFKYRCNVLKLLDHKNSIV